MLGHRAAKLDLEKLTAPVTGLRPVDDNATTGNSRTEFFETLHLRSISDRISSDGVVTEPRACRTLGSPLAKRMTKISYAGYRFPLSRKLPPR
jgi:hypothetical protein